MRDTDKVGRGPGRGKSPALLERMNSPLEVREVRLRGLLRRDFTGGSVGCGIEIRFQRSTQQSPPYDVEARTGLSGATKPVVHAGGLRVVVAANSFALSLSALHHPPTLNDSVPMNDPTPRPNVSWRSVAAVAFFAGIITVVLVVLVR
jgi:hypothetical protein